MNEAGGVEMVYLLCVLVASLSKDGQALDMVFSEQGVEAIRRGRRRFIITTLALSHASLACCIS